MTVYDKTLEITDGCIKSKTPFDSAGGLGYFLSAYFDGKFQKMVKSAIFDQQFYEKLKFPKTLESQNLGSSERQELEKLLRFLLAHFLHIRVDIMKSDLRKCLKSCEYKLPLQISIEGSSTSGERDVGDSAAEDFLEMLEINQEVKSAFKLSRKQEGKKVYLFWSLVKKN